MLDPVDGMTALVLHCVLDKGFFRGHHQREVVGLHGEIHANRELTAVAENLWAEAGCGVLDWGTVDAAVRDRAWNRLLERRAALSRMLAGRNRFEYGLWVFEGWMARCLRWVIAPITRSPAGRSTRGKR